MKANNNDRASLSIVLAAPITEDDPLQISICRDNKVWAVFDNRFNCIKDFVPYTSEAAAVAEALDWVRNNLGVVHSKLVYPQITKMTMTTRRVKKGK